MKFWDTSALVPLVVEEISSSRAEELFLQDGGAIVWWSTEVECASAIARYERTGDLTQKKVAAALRQLGRLADSWTRVDPSDALQRLAKRLLRLHDLRAADALQLAAAFLAAEREPGGFGFVCFDKRLSLAAEREGFQVFDQGSL